MDHVETNEDEVHDWEVLAYDDADEFRVAHHVDQGERLESDGVERADSGQYERAIDQLEAALEQFQKARAIPQSDSQSLQERCRSVLETIERVEDEWGSQELDDLLNSVERHLDAGDDARLTGAFDSAAEEYEQALAVVDQVEQRASDEREEVHRRVVKLRDRVDGRLTSLDPSSDHREVVETYNDALEHREAGDEAFRSSDIGRALEEYRAARTGLDRVMEKLDEFTFDAVSPNPSVCDICREESRSSLETVVLDHGTERTVCPACTMFAKDDLLPTPETVETERGYLTENTESLESGDYGLTWSSNPDTDTVDDAESDASRVDEPQMLIQLVGVYQQADGLPSPADLDEKTDFGYLAYSEQFGGIEDALREAGFDV
ncbi:hypothetical protein [Haloarchaeobius litoreus]|uniref:Tetratricopeptide repeat-containing protein n=1 Tax=Haloarchaeobius litoreus TaxID=755306 RepID=A0ABD6DLD0_9EURY|nr:hypothetical protein [Haloarchaeobius litoreus]